MSDAVVAGADTPRPTGFGRRVIEGFAWRWRFRVAPCIKRLFRVQNRQWMRVMSDRATEEFVRSLDYHSMDVVEMSPGSDKWRQFGFGSYRASTYPDYDLCEKPLAEEAFDIVLAEQVMEHVLWPYRAVRHVYQMLRSGGWFIVSTPFMLRVHDYPNDCSRWTELGLKHLLIEGGFPAQGITTGSWGNRACVRANLKRFPSWIPWWHSLHNEADFPLTVWAFARKSG
jgi:hypothetical protein